MRSMLEVQQLLCTAIANDKCSCLYSISAMREAHTCWSMALRLMGGLAEGLRLLVEPRPAGCHPPLAERERRGEREPLLGDEGLYREPSLNRPVFSSFSAACSKQHCYLSMPAR